MTFVFRLVRSVGTLALLTVGLAVTGLVWIIFRLSGALHSGLISQNAKLSSTEKPSPSEATHKKTAMTGTVTSSTKKVTVPKNTTLH
jgi:hypothetical protein